MSGLLIFIGVLWFLLFIIPLFADHSQDAIERELRRPLVPSKPRSPQLQDNTELRIVAAIVAFVCVGWAAAAYFL